MKKIIASLMLIVLLMVAMSGIVSAWDWDNVLTTKESETKYPILIIENALGLGDDIVRMELIKNTDQCLFNCHAIIDISIYEEIALFNESSFIDKKGRIKFLEYNIYYWHEDKEDIVVDDYGETCVDVYNEINKTTNLICTNEIIGFHEEEIITYDWKKYKGEVMPVGDYKFKLDGKKGKLESIDWSFNLIGISDEEIREAWAWWDTDFTKRKNITITNPEASAHVNEYKEFNITDISSSAGNYSKDIAILNNDSVQIERQVLQNGSDWALVGFLVNSSASQVQNYTVYYDNSGGTETDAEILFTHNATDNRLVWDFELETDGVSPRGWSGTSIASLTANSSQVHSGSLSAKFIEGNGDFGRAFTTRSDVTQLTVCYWRYFGSQGNWYFALDDDVVWSENFKFDTSATTNELQYWNSASWTDSGKKALRETWQYHCIEALDPETAILHQNGTESTGELDLDASTLTYINSLVFFTDGSTIGINYFDDVKAFMGRYYGGNNITYIIGEEKTEAGLLVSQTSPIDSFNSTSITINFIGNATDPIAVLNLSIFIDNVLNHTIYNTTANENLTLNTNINFNDGDYNWLLQGCSDEECSNTSSRSFNVNTTPAISFIDPTHSNNTNLTVPYIPVNVTITETYFKNITFTFYKDGIFNESLTFTDGTRFYNKSGWNGATWTYNVTVWTTTHQSNSTETRTVNIDLLAPNVTILAPIGQIESHVFGNNLSLNWSINDTNLAACWFEYNSANTTLTCGDNATNFIPVVNIQNLTLYANDTFGNANSDFTSWTYAFVENNATFNAFTNETSSESFILNMTTDLTVLSISGILSYNGTEHDSTASCTGGECLLSNTIDIPLILTETTSLHDFFWNFTIFNGTDSIGVESSTRTQNVSRIHLEECNATFPTKTLNFTTFDEQNLTRISPFQFDGTFDFWIGSGLVKRNNSFSKNTTEMNLCLNPNVTMKIDAIINYDEEINKTSVYTDRFYYFDEHEIDNELQHIMMYLLRSSQSTSFILKVQDENLLPVSEALIEIHRFYPGEGIFRIVQTAKTDGNGKSIGFFETETVDYKFIIKKAGEILFETPDNEKQKVVPETSPFTLTFNTGDDLGEPWSSQDAIINLNSELDWNPDTGIVSYIYVDNSSSFTQSRLLVQKQSLTNISAYITICNDTLAISSGTLTCTVGNTTGFYIASAFITRSAEALDRQISFQIEDFSSTAGIFGLFFGFFLILIATFMFKFNEIAGIWAITVTIFLVNIMGLIKFGAVFVSAIIGIAIILTWAMEK